MKKSIKTSLAKKYPRKAIAHFMSKRVPVAKSSQTAQEVYTDLRKNISDFDEIQCIYVVDGNFHLQRVVTLKELLHLSGDIPLADILPKKTLITLTPQAHREKAVSLALRYALKAVPVVDDQGYFLGAVPAHKILDILHEESREDISRLTGVNPEHGAMDNLEEIPLFQIIKHRLPWLLLGLGGGLFTARLIGFFEKTLAQNLILAAFIPLIVYMADAVGTQMEAFVIRDFALYRRLSFGRYFFKQFQVIILMSLILGIMLIGAGFVIFWEITLPLVLGIAMVLSILSSVFTGLLIPYFFRKLKVDPANASGPIATIIQDLLSVMIYFLIATWVLGLSQ